MCIYVYLCIYSYLPRIPCNVLGEKEGGKIYIYMYIHIFIFIYPYIHIYTYIYIYLYIYMTLAFHGYLVIF
jgi:hypothetical protein